MPANPEIAVVVPSHRAEEMIGDCLDALLAQTLGTERFEIHVVDSGEDGTGAIVTERAERWPGRLLLHRADGGGPGAKRNQGARAADAPFLAFTDADCAPDPAWLAAGLPHLRAGAAIVQGPTLTPDGSPPRPFTHGIFLPGPSPLFESCNILYEAGAFKDAGGFPVDLFDREGSYMGEDTELAWRVRRNGGQAVYEEAAVVRHAVREIPFSDHLAYEWQARFFPRLVRRVPELREEFLKAGVFLSPTTARVGAAVAGLALAGRSRPAMALTLPYAAELARSARGAPGARQVAGAMARRLISDVVREGALLWGSARFRSPVL